MKWQPHRNETRQPQGEGNTEVELGKRSASGPLTRGTGIIRSNKPTAFLSLGLNGTSIESEKRTKRMRTIYRRRIFIRILLVDSIFSL